MITGRDLVFISSVEWDFLWQVHQEIASQFAAAGNRVLYIENTGVRRPNFNDAGRVGRRLSHWSRSLLAHKPREVATGIFAVSPLVMPPFGSAASRLLNRRLFLPFIKRTVARIGMRDPLIWTYLPTDTALELIRLLRTPANAVVYYCGADFRLLVTNPIACGLTEDELIKSSDLIFATCDQLEQRCRRLNSNVHRIPALINLQMFSLATSNGDFASAEEPQLTKSSGVKRPIIGYAGGLHRYVDYDLLIEMARARPDWSWVFVGAPSTNINALLAEPNVKFLGQRLHDHLPQHMQEFDVCIVPYLSTDLTATVVPMKINEYLAMGKPIVSTPLPAVRLFNEQHQILSIAPNKCAPFLAAIEGALAWPNDQQVINRRRAVAALGDSRSFLERIGNLIPLKVDTGEHE